MRMTTPRPHGFAVGDQIMLDGRSVVVTVVHGPMDIGFAPSESVKGQGQRIADRCPACGAHSLFIGSGGWITCSVIGCKLPSLSAWREVERSERDAMANEILAWRAQAAAADDMETKGATNARVFALAEQLRHLEKARAGVDALGVLSPYRAGGG